MPQRDKPRPRPPAPADDWALFLDVDGCLLDFADRPADVAVPAPLYDTLAGLARRLDGALALVSGRSLRAIDALFAPLSLPAVGLHGLERRSAGSSRESPPAPAALASIREDARQLARRWPGVVVEDKGAALGLHWRGAPTAEDALLDFADAAIPRLHGYRLQHGNQVIELRPADGDKGRAIEALLEESPFRGRVPVFAGDDITDESGFAVVNRHRGLSILVGGREPSAAHYGLPGPEAVRGWLSEGVHA